MCPKHDTPCVLPEARGYTSWSASLTHWTADLSPLVSPESRHDPWAHSLAPAGSPGSQLTQQYCVMLSYDSLHTSAPPLHSGNQCHAKWMQQPYVRMHMLWLIRLHISVYYLSYLKVRNNVTLYWLFSSFSCLHWKDCGQKRLSSFCNAFFMGVLINEPAYMISNWSMCWGSASVLYLTNDKTRP